jgi:hypothetical protein
LNEGVAGVALTSDLRQTLAFKTNFSKSRFSSSRTKGEDNFAQQIQTPVCQALKRPPCLFAVALAPNANRLRNPAN